MKEWKYGGLFYIFMIQLTILVSLGGNIMEMNTGFYSFMIALVSLLGTAIIGIVTLRGDFKESVKIVENTTDTKPRVVNIESNVSSIPEISYKVTDIKKHTGELHERVSSNLVKGIEELIDDHKYKQRIRSNLSNDLARNKDTATEIVSQLYENAAIKEDEIESLKNEIDSKNSKIDSLEKLLTRNDIKIKRSESIMTKINTELAKKDIQFIVNGYDDVEIEDISKRQYRGLEL